MENKLKSYTYALPVIFACIFLFSGCTSESANTQEQQTPEIVSENTQPSRNEEAEGSFASQTGPTEEPTEHDEQLVMSVLSQFHENSGMLNNIDSYSYTTSDSEKLITQEFFFDELQTLYKQSENKESALEDGVLFVSLDTKLGRAVVSIDTNGSQLLSIAFPEKRFKGVFSGYKKFGDYYFPEKGVWYRKGFMVGSSKIVNFSE